jgi:hypothetical protein
VWKYQTKAYPLTQLPSAQSLPLVDGLDISGSSVVTGLYRQGDNIFLRLWNPLAKETARISAANMTFATCDLEGNILDQLGENSVEIVMEPMHICTLLLRRICADGRE